MSVFTIAKKRSTKARRALKNLDEHVHIIRKRRNPSDSQSKLALGEIIVELWELQHRMFIHSNLEINGISQDLSRIIQRYEHLT